ncbi:MAG: oprO 1 [Schlesneria sp.]|nr:oprO 1 [Schlesneria sp.]
MLADERLSFLAQLIILVRLANPYSSVILLQPIHLDNDSVSVESTPGDVMRSRLEKLCEQTASVLAFHSDRWRWLRAGTLALLAISVNFAPLRSEAQEDGGEARIFADPLPLSESEYSGLVNPPPAPSGDPLEQRLRQLELEVSSQKSEAELLRNRISEIGKSKESKPDPKSFKASWKNQLTFESADKNFTAHFGGRTQFDTVWLKDNPQAFGKNNGAGDADAVDFRRARLRMEGTIYRTTEYVMEYDLVNSVNDNTGLIGGLPSQPASAANVIGVPAPTDLWWAFKEVPIVGNVKIGNQKEPIGLEHANSSRYLDFMERSYNQDAYTGPFNNGFTPGILFYDSFHEDRGIWQLGAFKNVVNVFAYGAGDAAYAFDGRLAYLLWNEDEGRQLLHIGGSYSHRDPIGDAMRIRTRGSLRNGPGAYDPVFADTGVFLGNSQDMAAAEFSLVSGPFQLQSEYIASTVTDARNTAGTVNYGTYFTNGYYVMASYFLTGEHREYELKRGSFGRVVPKNNARWSREDCEERSWGAWQVLVRYSALDLNDNNLNGGQVSDWTFGVNWFLNPNMKIQANYVYTDRNSLNSPTAPGSGAINGFGMRVAHDF